MKRTILTIAVVGIMATSFSGYTKTQGDLNVSKATTKTIHKKNNLLTYMESQQ